MARRSSFQRRRQQPAHADWRRLPAPALLCVCQHLPDLVAFFAFAGTCRDWRDVANFGKKAFMASQPPLLCANCGERFYSPINAKCYKNSSVVAVLRRLMGKIVDVSRGYLVILAENLATREEKLVLLNPFTQHMVDSLPRLYMDFIGWVVLTAPPTSPDCVVIVHTNSVYDFPELGIPPLMKFIKYVRPGDTRWSRLLWRETRVLGTFNLVASADGKVYAWATDGDDDDQLELVVMEFPHGEEPTLTSLLTVPFVDIYLYQLCLAVPTGGGEQVILLVRASFVSPDGSREDHVKNATFKIYRLDASEQQLVQDESNGVLDGQALVMDCYMCVVASDPARWGGRGNHVYFSRGYGSETWRLGLMDGVAAFHYAPWPEMRHGGVFWLLPEDTCS